MGNEAASRLATEIKTDEYGFAVINTVSPVITTISDIMAMGISSLAMVTITLRFEQGAKKRFGRQETSEETTTTALLSALRRMVRRTDSVFLLDTTLYFLLLGANVQGGEIVQTRLWDALLWRIHNSDEGELLRPQSLMIGHSAYPVPCSDVYEFLAAASQPALHFELFAEKQTRRQIAQPGQQGQPGQQLQEGQQQAGEDELSSLARKLGIPYLSLLPRKPSHRIQQLVSPRLAQELRCYPVGRERNMLTVAMLDPQDQSALARLQQETGLSIFPVLTHPQELQTALEQLL